VTADRPLAEIVAEGRALCRPDWQGPKGYVATFRAEHFARLLAVAEAAMEAERLLRHALDESRGAGGNAEALWIMQSAAREALIAFDSAAGAREGEGR
jgi:hypothetical protein